MPINNDTDGDGLGNFRSLLKWIVLFLCVWQSVFTIPDTALEMMLSFLVTLLKVITDNASTAFITALATAMPASLYMLHKSFGSPVEDCFAEYVLCPACHTLYSQEECFIVNEDGDRHAHSLNIPITQ